MANIALNMFTQCLGGDSMRNGVRVVAVNPGPTISDRHLAHVKERAQRLLGDASRWPELHAKFPAGRAATVEEVARTVAFLASDQASFISGSGSRSTVVCRSPGRRLEPGVGSVGSPDETPGRLRF